MNQSKKMTLAFVGLGSNQGNRRRFLEEALRQMKWIEGVELIHVASLYETQPVGKIKQKAYYNSVAKLKTSLSPSELLKKLQAIEKNLGRKRIVHWGPRTIDLDLLAVGQSVTKGKKIVLPHPYYYKRRFVLVPFGELAPGFVHPVIKLTNRTLLRRLTLPGQRVTICATWKKERFYPFKKRKKKNVPSLP